MGYVVYSTESTRIVTETRYGKEVYATEAAAKAAKTRMVRKGKHAADAIEVAEITVYTTLIEKMVKRVNLMSGKEYYESVNTPNYCSPASEAYWSM